MWIRLLLLVAFTIGLNWMVSDHIKRQHKQQAAEIEEIEHTNLFGKAQSVKLDKDAKKALVMHHHRQFKKKKI